MSKDQIILTVPARGEYAKTVRMTAAALVSRMDMSYDDVDDVRIAAEEAFVYACDSAPESGEIELHFHILDDGIEIEVPIAVGSHADDEDAERRSAYATFILESVCDRYELSSDASGAWLRLVKHAAPVSADAG